MDYIDDEASVLKIRFNFKVIYCAVSTAVSLNKNI